MSNITLNQIIFTNNLPKIDIHGFDRTTAELTINDFIKENIKLKNEVFVIIHGIGSGILKNTTLNTLKKNKNVLEYRIDFKNPGCTLVRIKI